MGVSEDEWRRKLTPEQYRILREKGTELPGTGKFLTNQDEGVYICAACGVPLFTSDTKYDSTMPGLIGWPSFSEVASNDAVKLSDDNSQGMLRLEVICRSCDSHLGHLFEDSSSLSGKHYCINSDALEFKKKA